MIQVHSIETFGTRDGPGIRTVVFLQGCNMRCWYCQNPDTQSIYQPEAKTYTVAELMTVINKQKPYYRQTGGVTISGGEPTLQAHALLPLLRQCRDQGIHTCLDTCGSVYSARINQLYDLTDLVILDVKHIDPDKHKQLTGVSNQHALKNAAYREKTGKPMWLRYVLVPGVTDDPRDVAAWAQYFQQYRQVKRCEILPYHTLGAEKYQQLGRDYALAKTPPATPQQAHEAKVIFEKYLDNVYVA